MDTTTDIHKANYNLFLSPLHSLEADTALLATKESLINSVEQLLHQRLFTYGAGELKMWLLEACATLNVSHITKKRKIQDLLSRRKNVDLYRVLLKATCSHYPSEVRKFISSQSTLEHFFLQSAKRDTHVQAFFQHFSYDGKNKGGALAIEQYCFRNRDSIWSKYLRWTSPRPVTPIAASRSPELWLHLDIVASVSKLIKNTDFLQSPELGEALDSDTLVKINEDYFVEVLIDSYTSSSSRRAIASIVSNYIHQTPFNKLILLLFPKMEDNEILELLHNAISNPSRLHEILLTKKTDNFNQLLIFNALLHKRPQIVQSLLSETESNNAIEKLLEKFPLENPTQAKQDNLSHWTLFHKLIRTEYDKSHVPSILRFLLLEAFLIEIRLTKIPSELKQNTFQLLFQKENIQYKSPMELQLQESPKRKKHKPSTRERQGYFIGWALYWNGKPLSEYLHIQEEDPNSKPHSGHNEISLKRPSDTNYDPDDIYPLEDVPRVLNFFGLLYIPRACTDMAGEIVPTLVRFPITTQLQNGDPVHWKDLKVKVQGPVDIPDITVAEEGGKVFVSFQASVTGAYKCLITHQDSPLRNTPITINLGKKEETPPLEEKKAATTRSSRTIRFRVPSKYPANNLNVYVASGPDTNPSRSAVIQEGSQLAVCLDVTKPGYYRVGVKGQNGDIEHSPFKILVPQDAFDPK